MNKEHKIFLSVCGSILAVVAIAIFLSFGTGDSYAESSSDYGCDYSNWWVAGSDTDGTYKCCPTGYNLWQKQKDTNTGDWMNATCAKHYGGQSSDFTCPSIGGGQTAQYFDTSTSPYKWAGYCITDPQAAKKKTCYYCAGSKTAYFQANSPDMSCSSEGGWKSYNTYTSEDCQLHFLTYSYQDSDGKSLLSSTSVKYLYGERITLPTPPSINNCTFTGYYLNGAYKGTGGSILLMPNTQSTIVAKYNCSSTTDPTPKTYTITYKANGGSGTMSSQTKNQGSSVKISANEFSRNGFTFSKWNTKSDGTGTSYNEGSTYNDDDNLTLYAIWNSNTSSGTTLPTCSNFTTYHVAVSDGLDCRTGPGPEYSTVSGKAKGHCTTVQACKLNGYNYGYVKNGDGTYCYVTWSNTSTGGQFLTTSTPSSCQSAPTPITYTISYTMHGGTKGTKAPTSGTVGSDVQISNPTKIFTVTGDANNTGATVGSAKSKTQTFAGWTATGLGSGAKIGSSSSPSTSWDGTTATKLTYFKDLRSSSGTVTMTANWTPVKLNLPTISKSGYTCKWNTKADGTGTALTSGSEYTPSATTSSATVYAVCQKATATKFSVTYDANGGEDAPTAQEKTIDVDLKLSSVVPTREGYTFIWWNTEKNGSGATYLPGSKYKNNENVTLYAQWDEGETILVTYIFGDGEFSAESFDKGETITIDTDIPTKDGYTFGEWNTKKDGSGKTYKPGDKYTGDKDLTLYAIWGKNKDKTDDEPVQVQTGNALILVALVTGLAALCYILLYTKRMKTNN